ncbi:MAG: translocation/assembly module TamB domain-containing protein, partial [Candidatus Marinimicrobia bacterium]|nr:translocation/assembly module TamB domain-containing protein [Candidatus Neomarinimicrobiota bacterium]
ISDLNIWNANDEYFALQGVLFDNYNEFYVDSLTGNFRGVNFSSDDIHFTKLDNKFVLKKSLFKIGDGSAIATGDIIDSKKYRFWFNTENLNLSEVNTILGNDQRLQGIAKGEFHISMWEKYPIILSNVEIRNGVFDDIEFSKMLGKFSYRNNRLLFSEFSVNNQLGEISLSGWLTISGKDSASIFSETDSLKLNGSFDNFDLVSLNRYFPWSHNTEGLISGEFRMQGPASNPLFRMDLNINKPVFDKINGKSISGSIVYENKQLYMKGIKLLTDTGKYTCSGYLPVNLGLISTDIEHIKHYPMDIMITGKSKEFEFLLPYMAIIDSANGNYSYQLSITGTLKNPIRNGQVIVRDGSISLMPLENSFHSLNGIAFINNNRLILENFTATSYDVQNENSIVNKIKRFFTKETDKQEEPNITIKGSMSLENFFQPDYSLLLTANNLYLSTPADGFEGVGDANFTITGKDTIKITGEFTPHPYNFTVTSEFAKGDNNKLRKINPKKTIVYNIHVPLENIVKIENDYLDLVLEGDMNITAVGNEKFRYSGNLNVIDGTFFFNGNEYSQTGGTIILDPTTAIPKLDLHASTNVAGEGVDIVLLGELDNPNLILESEHGYSQNDIIELLLFRNSPSDENEIAINKAGNFVSNYLENEFERNITKYTIIDKFQVHSSGSLMSGYDDSSLSLYIGKNLSNKTYVNIKSGVNNEENTFEYELGYRLNRNMSIIGRIDEDRYLHLNYKIKYRY